MKFRYCTECASPLTQRDATEYVCGNGHEYWNEPHGSVCVAVLRDGQVLLARRGVEPRKGKFVLPGGFVDFDETPYEAARREMAEETGLRCPELDLLEVHTIRYRENEASLSIVFHARRWEGEPHAGDDAAALVWRPVEFVESDEYAWPIPGLSGQAAGGSDEREQTGGERRGVQRDELERAQPARHVRGARQRPARRRMAFTEDDRDVRLCEAHALAFGGRRDGDGPQRVHAERAERGAGVLLRGLHHGRVEGTAAHPPRVDPPARVGVHDAHRRVRGRAAQHEAVREEHDGRGEPAAAHVAALPHLLGVRRGQGRRHRAAADRAARVVAAVRADEVQRLVEALARCVRHEWTGDLSRPDLLVATPGVDAEPASRSPGSGRPAGTADEQHPSARPRRPRRQRVDVGGVEPGLREGHAPPRPGVFQQEPPLRGRRGALPRVTRGVRRVGAPHHGRAAGTTTPSRSRRRTSTTWSVSGMPGSSPTTWVPPPSNAASAAPAASGKVTRRSGSSSTSRIMPGEAAVQPDPDAYGVAGREALGEGGRRDGPQRLGTAALPHLPAHLPRDGLGRHPVQRRVQRRPHGVDVRRERLRVGDVEAERQRGRAGPRRRRPAPSALRPARTG